MIIEGDWPTRVVKVNHRVLSAARSQRVWNHSPDGFNWGYSGSGPAQLALALLLRAGCSHELAVRLHQQFKHDVIAPLPQRDFRIEVDVAQWIAKQGVRNDV